MGTKSHIYCEPWPHFRCQRSRSRNRSPCKRAFLGVEGKDCQEPACAAEVVSNQTTLRRVAKSILRSRVWVKLPNFWRSPR
jgi:hypothetical protein